MSEPSEKTNTTPTPASRTASKPDFTSAQLENALLYVEHVMESLPLKFFLMDDLANYVYRNQQDSWLTAGSVDTITVGVRKQWLTPDVIKTFQTLVPEWGTMPSEWQFEHYGVPIRVSIVERNYTYLQNLDFKFHLGGEYFIPNPFEKYWAGRYLVK